MYVCVRKRERDGKGGANGFHVTERERDFLTVGRVVVVCIEAFVECSAAFQMARAFVWCNRMQIQNDAICNIRRRDIAVTMGKTDFSQVEYFPKHYYLFIG